MRERDKGRRSGALGTGVPESRRQVGRSAPPGEEPTRGAHAEGPAPATPRGYSPSGGPQSPNFLFGRRPEGKREGMGEGRGQPAGHKAQELPGRPPWASPEPPSHPGRPRDPQADLRTPGCPRCPEPPPHAPAPQRAGGAEPRRRHARPAGPAPPSLEGAGATSTGSPRPAPSRARGRRAP